MNLPDFNESPHERQQRILAIVRASSELELLTGPHTQKTKDTRDRVAVLLSKIASLRAGFAVEQCDLQELNAVEERNGLRRTQSLPSVSQRERRAYARAWQVVARGGNPLEDAECRAGLVGNALFSWSQGTGNFVPKQFFSRMNIGLKVYSPLFDADKVTYWMSESGAAMDCPTLDDTSAVATELSESSANNEVDLVTPGHVTTQPSKHSFRAPSWIVSLESIQDVNDLDGVFVFEDLFLRFALPRIARGVGKGLCIGPVAGNSINGLVTSLIAQGAVGRTAQGSSANDGSSATGANSIGSDDIKALCHSVDPLYRLSPKAAWLATDATYQAIDQLKDRQGRPLKLIQWGSDGCMYLMGKRALVDPNMEAIGPSNYPLLFGDLSFWLTHVSAQGQYVRVFSEAPNLAEFGLVELVAFYRADGALLYNGSAAQCPVQLLQNHS